MQRDKSRRSYLRSSATRRAARSAGVLRWVALVGAALLWGAVARGQESPQPAQRWEELGAVQLGAGERLVIRSQGASRLMFYLRALDDLQAGEKKTRGMQIRVDRRCTVQTRCYGRGPCHCPGQVRPIIQLLAESKAGWYTGPPLFETAQWRSADGFWEFEIPGELLPQGGVALWAGFAAEAAVNGVALPPAREIPGLYRYIRIERDARERGGSGGERHRPAAHSSCLSCAGAAG